MYTQQQIVQLYKQLIPSIKQFKGQLQVNIRGQQFMIKKNESKSTTTATSRNLQYR